MKKNQLLFITLLVFALNSCKLEGESYRHFYGKINIDTLMVQDSAVKGDTVFIHALAGAPNGCWSDIDLFFYPYNDTLYLINSFAWYESYDGVCTDIYITKDSTFQFVADTTGTFIFVSDSENRMPKYDTLIVVL